MSPCSTFATLLAFGTLALACSGDDSAGDGGNTEQSGLPNLPPQSAGFQGVRGYERAPGMMIGQGAGDPEGNPEPMLGGGTASTPSDDPNDIEIPTFEPPTEDPPPCSGCVELNVDVNDINQRDTFAFSAGGVNVTRVVWTLVIPFNSDQLFVQPFVDSAYGTYTQLHANTFAIDTPVQLVHQYAGTANNVGLALGSSGAWTGDMTMSVYVDSVTLEGAAAASRTFDTDAQGITPRSAARNPQVVFHP